MILFLTISYFFSWKLIIRLLLLLLNKYVVLVFYIIIQLHHETVMFAGSSDRHIQTPYNWRSRHHYSVWHERTITEILWRQTNKIAMKRGEVNVWRLMDKKLSYSINWVIILLSSQNKRQLEKWRRRRRKRKKSWSMYSWRMRV